MAAFTALAIASLALSAYGQIKAGKASKAAGKAQHAAADSQADLADYNASVADLQAKDAIARGVEQENRFRSGVRLMIGSQRAATAGSNIDVGYGSALDVQADAAFLGELDALTIRTNAGREAWGFETQGEDLRRRGEIARKEGVYLERAGNAAGNAAYVGAAGTIAGGSMNLLEARYGFNRTSTRVPTLASHQYATRAVSGPTLG